MDFSEEEVREELRRLGYNEVPPGKMQEFMSDLKQLADHERSRSDTESSVVSDGNDQTGLARYPSHTSYHWGSSKAFQKTRVPQADSSDSYSFSFEESQTSKKKPRSPRPASPSTDDSLSSTSIVRRKVLRRDSRGNHDISTEELTYVDEDETDSLFDTDSLPLDARTRTSRSNRPRSAPTRRSSGASYGSDGYHLSSFIRRPPDPPKVRHDPVNKYHEYKEAWTNQRAPGEKQHKDLRWNVREMMQRRDPVFTPTPRNYVPNDYVPPTEKKRQNLRWQIRTQLAHKINPSKKGTAFDVWM